MLLWCFNCKKFNNEKAKKTNKKIAVSDEIRTHAYKMSCRKQAKRITHSSFRPLDHGTNDARLSNFYIVIRCHGRVTPRYPMCACAIGKKVWE